MKNRKPEFTQMPVSLGYVNKAVIYLGILLLCLISIIIANIQGVIVLPSVVYGSIEKIGIVVGSYLLASIFLRLTSRKVSTVFANSISAEHRILLAKIYSGIIYLLATLVVLWELGVTMDNLALIIGLSATGVAFAIRDLLLSYLVWFVLLFKRPFKIGDYIRFGEVEGVVLYIGTFYVLIDPTPKTFDDYIRIPNKLFLEKPIFNLGSQSIPISVSIPVKVSPKKVISKLNLLQKKLSEFCPNPIETYLQTDRELFILKISTFVPPAQKEFFSSRIIVTTIQTIE